MLVLLFVLCTGAIFAQTTSGSITGVVVDAQEAAISGAAVTITEQGKNFTLTTVLTKTDVLFFRRFNREHIRSQLKQPDLRNRNEKTCPLFQMIKLRSVI